MKTPIYFIFILLVCLISCKQKTKEPAIDIDHIQSVIDKGKKSDIIERNMFAGFKIGMAEEQVDSNLHRLYAEGKVVNYGGRHGYITEPIQDKMELSYYRLYDNDTIYYIRMYPTYCEGKLSGMTFIAECEEGNMTAEQITDKLVALFKYANSDRINEFESVGLTDGVCSYIKDNMWIVFFPQKNYPHGTMQFSNLPDSDKLEAEREKKNDFRL